MADTPMLEPRTWKRLCRCAVARDLSSFTTEDLRTACAYASSRKTAALENIRDPKNRRILQQMTPVANEIRYELARRKNKDPKIRACNADPISFW